MAVISEIKNLTTGKFIYHSEAVAPGTGEPGSKTNPLIGKAAWKEATDGGNAYSASVSFATNSDIAIAGLAAPTDNIQVMWGKERAAGGKLVAENAKSFSISNLQDLSKMYLELKGLIEVGPNAEVSLSVKVGNRNASRDMILDFSDKTDDAPPTTIKLKALMAWLSGQSGAEGNVNQLPEPDSKEGAADVKEFELIFNEFHFNVTRKSFAIEVVSTADSEFKFGAFTLKNIGFILTNEAPKDLPALPA